MLGIFGLRFLLGNQHAVAMGEFHLHVGNAGARRCSRCVLNGKFGDAGQFPEAGEIALLRNERILLVHMDAAKESCRARFEQESFRSSCNCVPSDCWTDADSSRFKGKRKLQAFGLLAKQGENGGIAPLGKNHVGVFAFEQVAQILAREVRPFRRVPSKFHPFRFRARRGDRAWDRCAIVRRAESA